MAVIQDLPNEILHQIAQLCGSNGDLVRWSLVCKRWTHPAQCELWSTVSLPRFDPEDWWCWSRAADGFAHSDATKRGLITRDLHLEALKPDQVSSVLSAMNGLRKLRASHLTMEVAVLENPSLLGVSVVFFSCE